MRHQSNIADTSGELIICRFNNGIKLIRPDQISNIKYTKILRNTGHTIDSLLQLPFPVYLEDTSHFSIKSNEETAKACGFVSLNDFIGKPPFKYFKKETILPKLSNHTKVIKENAMVIAEESALRQDGNELNTLSVRMPWYNDQHEIIGLFGCSIILGTNPLAESLTNITRLGLLNNLDYFQHNQHQASSRMDSIYLSKRELECLRLTVMGNPAKQVAYTLGLSQRTVEEYLDNIKRKMKVSSKSALIERGMEYFFKDMEKT